MYVFLYSKLELKTAQVLQFHPDHSLDLLHSPMARPKQRKHKSEHKQ